MLEFVNQKSHISKKTPSNAKMSIRLDNREVLTFGKLP